MTREAAVAPKERLERLEGEKTVAILSAAALGLLVVLPLVSALFVPSAELALKLVECGKDFGLISLGAFGSVVYCFLGGRKKNEPES